MTDSLDAIYRRLDFARIAQVDLEHKRAIGTREACSLHSPATFMECSYNFSAEETRGASDKDCFSTHFLWRFEKEASARGVNGSLAKKAGDGRDDDVSPFLGPRVSIVSVKVEMIT